MYPSYYYMRWKRKAGKLPDPFEKLVILLPPSSNDKGLAMTGSYSGMLLCGILITHLKEIESLGKQISILHDYGKKILSKYSEKIREIASVDFKRAVFLGSGPSLEQPPNRI